MTNICFSHGKNEKKKKKKKKRKKKKEKKFGYCAYFLSIQLKEQRKKNT